MFIYTALFIGLADRMNSKLDRTIGYQHVTHEFRPTEINKELFGQKATLKVVGYGIDAENEGYLVEIKEASEELRKVFASVEIPHLTIGISKSGKAVNTKNLKFEAIEPFEIVATYGGFNGKNVELM